MTENKNIVQVGNPVPIEVQLRDGAPAREVRVNVYDPIKKLIGSFKLSEGPMGLYFTNFFSMPDLPFVTVQAHVEGVDSLGQEYGVGSERFYSTPKPKPPEKVLRGYLSVISQREKILKGALVETSTI